MNYEARILGHLVSVKRLADRFYRIEVDGPKISVGHPDRFLLRRQAQVEAHVFAHSMLATPCSCKVVTGTWTEVGFVPV